MNKLLEQISKCNFVLHDNFQQYNLKLCNCENIYQIYSVKNENEIFCKICNNIFDVQLFVLLCPPYLSCYISELFFAIKSLTYLNYPNILQTQPDLNKFLCKIKINSPYLNYCEIILSLKDFENTIRLIGMLVSLFYNIEDNKWKIEFSFQNNINVQLLKEFNNTFLENFENSLKIFQKRVCDSNLFDFVSTFSQLFRNLQLQNFENTSPIEVIKNNVIPKLKFVFSKFMLVETAIISQNDNIYKLDLLNNLVECLNLVNKIYNVYEIDLDKTLHFFFVYIFLQRKDIPTIYESFYQSFELNKNNFIECGNMYEYLMIEDMYGCGLTNVIDIVGSLLNRIAKVNLYEPFLWSSEFFLPSLKIRNELLKKNNKFKQLFLKLCDSKDSEFLSCDDIKLYNQLKKQFTISFKKLLKQNHEKNLSKTLRNEYFPYIMFFKTNTNIEEQKLQSHSYYAFLFTLNYTKLQKFMDKKQSSSCLFSFSTKSATKLYLTIKKLLEFIYKNIPGHVTDDSNISNIREVNNFTFNRMKFYLDKPEIKDLIVDLSKFITPNI